MDDFLNAMDPNRNGFVQAMDPNRNGVADHFDPQKNGMAINFSKESINQQNTVLKGTFSTNKYDQQQGKQALLLPLDIKFNCKPVTPDAGMFIKLLPSP